VSGPEAILDTGRDIDNTLWVAIMVRLVRQELDVTERSVMLAARTHRRRVDRIARETKLNRRQLLIVATALAEPTRRFMIDSHSRASDVARATARADLLGLTALGYLRQERESHAFVFSPTPKLLDLEPGAV
jgi:Fic family protein